MGKTRRRARGTGSVFFDIRRRVWVGRVIVGRKPGGAPRYAERSDPSQAAMLAKLAAVTPPGPSVTLAAWAARWLADMRVRPTTRASRTNAVHRWIVPSLGHHRVRDLTAAHCTAAARDWLARGLGPNTARVTHAILHTCLAAAVDAGIRDDNPASRAKPPPRAKTRAEPFTPAEIHRVIRAATARPAARVIALLAATGLRAGEALALDVDDFDPARGTVRVTKTAPTARRGESGPAKTPNSVRTIRVPAPALPAVRAAAGTRTAGPLFTAVTGSRRTYGTARKVWVSLLRNLGLPYRPLHQLRHTAATALVGAGKGLADVGRYLGDSPQTVLRVYAHATGADMADCLEGLYGGRKVGATSRKGAKTRRKAGNRRRR